LPKRVRCPYCDGLFSRDILDDHIRRCRERNHSQEKNGARGRNRNVIVDGNNVAYHLSPNGRPQAKNLLLAFNSLTTAGYRPVFVISNALNHAIDKIETLDNFISSAHVIIAPRGTNDDLKIIKTAQERNADIISNDRFLDWINRYPWVSDRLRRYRMTPTGLILT
jgi:hypothetical protein